MATNEQLKSYLACWFQLGKPVISRKGDQRLLPQPVLSGDRYSPAFESCWQQIQGQAADYCLEGTNEAVSDLLNPRWEIADCARCQMPTLLRAAGLPPEHCPCQDMNNWPNTELPLPHVPVNNALRLRSICHRLQSY
jgi:hypothetical protein